MFFQRKFKLLHGGIRHGSTDETGAKAEQDKVHHLDLHATMLHTLGLDHERRTCRCAGRNHPIFYRSQKLTALAGTKSSGRCSKDAYPPQAGNADA